MYGIFTYIWLICMVNVGKYSIHGSFGYRRNDPRIVRGLNWKVIFIEIFDNVIRILLIFFDGSENS